MVRRAGDRALVRHGHDAVASVGISFLFRPLGAYLAGSFGDRYGRCIILVVTLILMGAATTLIGVLPTMRPPASSPRSCSCCCASCRASPPAASGAASP